MLTENVIEVEKHVQAACDRAGRSRDEVTLIAVSKTKPVEMMMASAVISSREPSAFFTDSFLGPVNAASPSITATLFIFSKLLTPPVSFLEMSFLWAMT